MFKNVFKGIHNRIERWLHREEIQHMQAERAQQMEQMKEQLEPLLKELETIRVDFQKAEQGIKPAGVDVDRYYDYHKRYVAFMQKTWGAAEVQLIDKTKFVIDAADGGWEYLKDNCGMNPPKQASPWSTANTGVWKTTE